MYAGFFGVMGATAAIVFSCEVTPVLTMELLPCPHVRRLKEKMRGAGGNSTRPGPC